MKNNWRNNIALAVVILIMFLTACTKSGEQASHADTYTCSMHPTIVSDKPGLCPICGMELVKKAQAGEEVKITDDLTKLLKSPNEIVVGSIKTINASYKTVPLSIAAQGFVTHDPRNLHAISTRVSGRLEKMLVKYDHQAVRQGQKVAEIYSPELTTAQRELLYLLESDAQNNEMIQSAKEKLALLGATRTQIETFIQSKEVQYTFTIYSPYSGYVMAEGTSSVPSAATSTSSQMDVMGASSTSASTTASATQIQESKTLLREGSYVYKGQTLFKIIDPSSLRVELDVPASLGGYVKKGQKVQLQFSNGHQTSATVDFIQPFFTQDEEFVKLRVYTSHHDQLHFGHLVNATIKIEGAESLWIPKESVLDLGFKQVVFVKQDDVFQPIEVVLGTKADGWIEVTRGLSTSEEIAANAQYLVDSESFVKTKRK